VHEALGLILRTGKKKWHNFSGRFFSLKNKQKQRKQCDKCPEEEHIISIVLFPCPMK
jgi:hypothetical protein